MPHWLIVVVILSLISLATWIATPWLLKRRGVYVAWKTKFGPAFVFETEDEDKTAVRVLNVGGTFQSMSYTSDELWCVPVCLYHRLMAREIERAKKRRGMQQPETADARQPETADARQPFRILVLGGGGYSLPKYLIAAYDDIHVDVVEIDPAMTQLAHKHFGLDRLVKEYGLEESGRLGLICDDAMSYLASCQSSYDVIVNDAFSRKKPLQQLLQSDGMSLIQKHLLADGIYLANVMCPLEGKGSELLDQARAACEPYFDEIRVLAANPENPTKPETNVLVATLPQ